MSHTHFKHVVLMGRPGKEINDTLENVKNFLLNKKMTLSLEKITAEMMACSTLPTCAANKFSSEIDLMIVVGGDGSLLNAAHLALPHNLPVLGINRGRLGFLTDIHPNFISKIDDVLEGKYKNDPRFVLSTTHFDHDKSMYQNIAINDVVLLPGDLAQMIDFDIFIDDDFVCHQRADGLIIATPTGSTAYALSGGGPIVHPELDAIVLVPMFPHTLSSRPIVVSGDKTIRLQISKQNDVAPHISCDGQKRIAIQPGHHLTILKHHKKLRLIHPLHYEYFATLREKLGWQSSAKKE